jgi:hypothetical protein
MSLFECTLTGSGPVIHWHRLSATTGRAQGRRGLVKAREGKR